MAAKRYYAVPLVVHVEADSADEATELVTPHGENELSEDGNAYLGVVYVGKGCPITPAMAGEPLYDAYLYYDTSGEDAMSGRVQPLMDGDE